MLANLGEETMKINNCGHALSWFLHFLIILLFVPSANVIAKSIGMVTGSVNGTYIQIGRDIARVAHTEGLEIEAKQSEGSLDNIDRITSKENAAFGIVQSDVLGFLKNDPSPKVQKVARRLRMIFPFYNEEVHILARKEITKFSDLDGKRVAVGRQRSGTWLTANNLFRIVGIKPIQQHDTSSEAIQKVLLGELDAMFYVAGKPVKAFLPLAEIANAQNDPSIQAFVEKVHFLPLTDERIFVEYDIGTLSSNDYPWMNHPVQTAAVRAILVGFDFSKRTNNYYKTRCAQFARLARAVRNNIDELRATGHKKWMEIDLDRDVGIWKHDTCSMQNMGNNSGRYSKSGDSIRDILDKHFQ